MFATFARDDGTMQVSVNGLPLYTFGGDTAPGDTNGQGVGDVWYVVGANGRRSTAGRRRRGATAASTESSGSATRAGSRASTAQPSPASASSTAIRNTHPPVTSGACPGEPTQPAHPRGRVRRRLGIEIEQRAEQAPT